MLFPRPWSRALEFDRPLGKHREPVSLVLECLEDRIVPSSSAGTSIAAPEAILLSSAASASPQAVSVPGPYTPAQIRQAYGFNNITFNNGTVKGDGSGQTIAIIDAYDDPNIASDLHAFDARYALPDPTLTVARETINGQSPAVDPSGGWELEESLDVEWAHAMAPGAKILLVEASDASVANLFSAVQWAVGQPGVSVVSMSFGLPEYSSQTSLDSIFTTPAGHPGVTFVAASGDQGTISYPAASPNVLAVGGTSLTMDGSGKYVSETAWNGSGGGISAYESEPGYQQSVQAAGRRGSPDLAYDAAPGTGYWVYDSFDNGQSPWQAVGGTSAGAPQWAALIAIANQRRALQGLGTLDGASQTLPMLYSVSGSAFHDVTSGGNVGYSAGPGYDLVTGLGSPHADRVAAALAQQPLNSTSLPSQSSTQQPSASQPTGLQTSGAQPPASQSPVSQQPVNAPSSPDRVGADALFVAQGLESHNLSLVLLGLQNFEAVFWNSSAAVQTQLQQDFLADLYFDLW
jgi:subtilase family serine protease